MAAGGTVALLGAEHPDQFADDAVAVERRDGRARRACASCP